mgnify:CR=1 FL=1|jgi:hypothetical protein
MQDERKRRSVQAPDAERISVFWTVPDDALLDRKTVAAGIGRSTKWVELKACTGGFVEFIKSGNKCLYRKGDVLAWLEANGRRVRTTSELSVGVSHA